MPDFDRTHLLTRYHFVCLVVHLQQRRELFLLPPLSSAHSQFQPAPPPIVKGTFNQLCPLHSSAFESDYINQFDTDSLYQSVLGRYRKKKVVIPLSGRGSE